MKSLFSRKRAALFAIMVTVGTASAQESESTPLQKVLTLSGYDEVIVAVEEQAGLEIIKERITSPEHALTALEADIFTRELKAAVLRPRIESALNGQLSADDLEYLIAFYQKPLMKKYRAAEQQFAPTNDAAMSVNAYLRLIQKEPLSRERIKALNGIQQASLATGQQIFILAATTRERAKASLEYQGKYDSEAIQKLDYNVTQFKASIEANVRNQSRLEFARLLQDFSDAELGELRQLLEDETRIKFQVAATDALVGAIRVGLNKGVKGLMSHREKPQT